MDTPAKEATLGGSNGERKKQNNPYPLQLQGKSGMARNY